MSEVELTRNQQLVMKTLENSDGPLSAYTILDALRESGFRAPPQVYRALTKLTEAGLVHRLDSLNAFVACSQDGCRGHGKIAFTICEDCGQVEEISNEDVAEQLAAIARKAKFQAKSQTLELRGTCGACLAN